MTWQEDLGKQLVEALEEFYIFLNDKWLILKNDIVHFNEYGEGICTEIHRQV